MPTNHFFAMFKPSQWLVRTELRINEPAKSEVSWRNNCFQISCESWSEALDEVIRLSEHWDSEIREYFPDLYVRFNRTGPGSWIVEGFDAESLCPKQIAVDCEVYVCGVIGGEEKWFLFTNHFRNELEAFAEPEPDQPEEEPEPEPVLVVATDDNWYVVAKEYLERLQSEPEPDPEYQPETLIIPIPSWDWVETEPEQPQPDPIPDNRYWRNEPTLKHVQAVTISVLTVTVKTEDKLCRGYKTFEFDKDYETALRQSRLKTDLIINQIVDAYCSYDTESYEHDFLSNCVKLEWTPICHYNAIEWVTIQWQFFLQELPLEWQTENDEWQRERALWIGTQTVEFGSVDGVNRIAEVWYCKEYAIEWIRGASRSFALSNDLGDRALTGTESLETFWSDDPIEVWGRNHWDYPRPTFTAKAVKLV